MVAIEDDSAVSLHRLLSRVIREDMTVPELRDAAALVVSLLESALPDSTREDQDGSKRQTINSVIEHLAALGTSDNGALASQSEAFASVLLRTRELANHAGINSSAITLEQATEAVGDLLGPDHPYTLAARNNLARAYESTGRLEEAIALPAGADRLRAGPGTRPSSHHPDSRGPRGRLAVPREIGPGFRHLHLTISRPLQPLRTGPLWAQGHGPRRPRRPSRRPRARARARSTRVTVPGAVARAGWMARQTVAVARAQGPGEAARRAARAVSRRLRG